jgi:hypothetical protein
LSAAGEWLAPGSSELAARCTALVAGGKSEPLACSEEAPVWGGIGLLLYLGYGYRNSHVGRGIAARDELAAGGLREASSHPDYMR